VVQRFVERNPQLGVDQFPLPLAANQTNVSWRGVGYVGFGKLGPLDWDNFFARYQRLHPQGSYTETFMGKSVDIYVADLTRDRYQLQLGNEMILKLVPDRLDAVWAVLYGQDRDSANTIAASEANRSYMSTVLRLQLYLTSTVHVLLENALSQEHSLNGNLYRTNFDSIFQSAQGSPDTRGLEFGDAAVRNCWQLKTGVVLNPTGFGVYARPSIRLLYGFQLSSQHAAFGNAFVDRLDQFDAFKQTGNIFWHHLVSLESEGWF
jgi:hypothetical protein